MSVIQWIGVSIIATTLSGMLLWAVAPLYVMMWNDDYKLFLTMMIIFVLLILGAILVSL